MENILIVDDDPSVLAIISELIKKWEYNSIKAGSAKEAIEKFKNLSIDLVVTDLVMPEMDGISLIQKLNEMRQDTIIIVLTGYPSIDSAVQAIKAGAYDYLSKPVQAQELKVKISRALERKNLLRSKSVLKGMNWALIISIPFWLILGMILANFLK